MNRFYKIPPRQHFQTVSIYSALLMISGQAAEYHVSPSGNNTNPGTAAAPFATIQRAADIAQPGDVITVHAGIYRERISPPRGGTSDKDRIVYQAAPNEKVVITGAELVKKWDRVQNDTWKATVPNSLFGSFNPYTDVLRGDWYKPLRPALHTGAVYLNGDWLQEALSEEDVLKPKIPATHALWFAKIDPPTTTLWAQFPGFDPNEQVVEINVRQTVFYPEKTGINYITVRGFTLTQAATPWAPPTAEQIGLIGTHWSKGWIIENNHVSYSTCSGISLGKYGDEFDNKSESAVAYNQTIDRALVNGWSRDNVGSHIVRHNTVSHCEQVGIVGSLGAIFSTITDNEVYDIHVRHLFDGAEMAGIKLHGAVDVLIARNHIHDNFRGIWLDWMAQGTRLTGNLINASKTEDLFLEVNHGPYLVDNNFFLSHTSVTTWSNGGAFVHNYIAGQVKTSKLQGRQTPFLKPHGTEVAGLHDNPRGGERWENNLLCSADLSQYNDAVLPVQMEGNVFFKGAKPCSVEMNPTIEDDEPQVALTHDGSTWTLHLQLPDLNGVKTNLITTENLGMATIPNQPFTNPDGSPLTIDTDYFGNPRSKTNPTPGPIEHPPTGTADLKLPINSE